MRDQLLKNILYLFCPEDSSNQFGLQYNVPWFFHYLKGILWVLVAFVLAFTAATICC